VKQIIKNLSFALGSVSAVAVLTVAPVWAEHGVSAEGDTTSTNSHSGPGTGPATTNTTPEPDDSTEVKDLRLQAKQLLQTKRQTVKEHTTTEKQKACEAHQAEVNHRSAKYAAAAQRHLDVFNKIFTRVQDFQTTKKLNVPDYDTLVATATAKQTAAQAAVDALKAVDVKLDCTQTDPANSVATLKTAVANARTALQDYRKAIKDVVVALKGASTAASSDTSTSTTTTTGGDQ
jgi:hypothetical protein